MSVHPEKQQALKETLQRLSINQGDVVERFVRSRGAGGQKVNKTSSAVYLKHLPTGIEVKMQKDRSQAVNRFLAWRLLAEKVEAALNGVNRKKKAAEKVRKQKDRRRRRRASVGPPSERISDPPSIR